ncbi:MAG: YybH family protein [Bythopirellula sp.]
MASTSKSHRQILMTRSVLLTIVLTWLAVVSGLPHPSAAENAADQLAIAGANAAADSMVASIREVLQTQQQMWNAGDIERFMDHYWKSDKLTFSSGGKVTRSWQSTLDNYRKRYATRSLMGKLSFRNLEVTPLGETAALVLGEWQLQRDSGKLGGNFTLVFRFLNGRWVIVHDHTSSNSPA